MLALWVFGCSSPRDLSTPLAACETFKKAIAQERWDVARSCLSETIQRENGEALASAAAYSTRFWSASRGTESLFADRPPLIETGAAFAAARLDGDRAIVELSYPEHREKAVRLQRLTLERDAAGNWRIIELFGRTRGIDAAPGR